MVPSLERIAYQWLLRQAAIFEAPPKMLAEAQGMIKQWWAEGLLQHLQTRSAQLEERKAVALKHQQTIVRYRRKARSISSMPGKRWSKLSVPYDVDHVTGEVRLYQIWLRRVRPDEMEEHLAEEGDFFYASAAPYVGNINREREKAAESPSQIREDIEWVLGDGAAAMEGWLDSINRDMQETREVEAFARKEGAQGPSDQRYRGGHVTLDLTGWKYLPRILETYQDAGEASRTLAARVRQAGWKATGITLFFIYERNPNHNGIWMGSKGEIQVHPPDDYSSSIREMRQALRGVLTTTRHEVQHAAQDMLRLLLDLPEDAGLPPRRVRDPQVDGAGVPRRQDSDGSRVDHEIRDVEFQTRLADEFDRLSDYFNSPNGQDTRESWDEILRYFIGASSQRPPPRKIWPQKSQWFIYLKENDKPRWREATRKLVAELRKHGFMDQFPQKKRRLPIGVPNHPAWSQTVMSYFQKRYHELKTTTWKDSAEVREAERGRLWETIRSDYQAFTDSLTEEQLVRHKELVHESGNGWEYWVTPRLQGWDGVSRDLPETSKETTPHHPRMPARHR